MTCAPFLDEALLRNRVQVSMEMPEMRKDVCATLLFRFWPLTLHVTAMAGIASPLIRDNAVRVISFALLNTPLISLESLWSMQRR